MRTFTPIVIHNGKGIKYKPLNAEKSIEFANRNQNKEIIFETTANGITEQLTVKKLIELNTF